MNIRQPSASVAGFFVSGQLLAATEAYLREICGQLGHEIRPTFASQWVRLIGEEGSE